MLQKHAPALSRKVSDRCFSELESYRRGEMAQEESIATVARLLNFLIDSLRNSSHAQAPEHGSSVHDEIVTVEEGIAARRVKLAIEFEDLLRGLQIMRREVWNTLAEATNGLAPKDILVLEHHVNQVFDGFYLGLSSSYRKSQSSVMREQEKALEKWEEVVKSASQIRLKIPCETQFAAIVRLQAEAIARRVSFSEEEIYDIIMAVGEVCDNAIEHGVSEMGVDVQYLITSTEFRVEVQDYGEGFDPAGRGLAPPDLFSESGRGIFLMKNLMDRVEIDSQVGRGTRIVMAKARPLGSSRPAST